jgi:hypothetical protein
VNLQGIERLQNLLGRIAQNVKSPHKRTQGLGAFIASPAPAAAREVAPAPAPEVDREGIAPRPLELAVSLAPETAVSLAPETAVSLAPELAVSVPPDSLPSDLLEPESPADAALAEPPLEDVSLEEVSAVELSAAEISSEELPAEPASESAPAVALAAVTATPYTAPPSLDELTFSEPPPPNLPAVAEIEPPPVSAAQAVSEPPDSIDAALLAATEANAADALEAEAPAVTPPPQSGPQVAAPPLAAPSLPTRVGVDSSTYREATPTAEQLGEVIELDQGSGPPLELADPALVEPKPAVKSASPEELEFVPQAPSPSRPTEVREAMQTLVGGFTDELDTGGYIVRETPPPPARKVLPAVEERPAVESSPDAAPMQPIARSPSMTMPAAGAGTLFGDEAPTASSMLTPEVMARAPVEATRPIVDVVAVAQSYRPQSFLELLDASLGLLAK